MTDSVVVDTNVITYATYDDDEGMFPVCAALVLNIIEGDEHKIAIDSELKVVEEYTDNIKRNRGPMSKLISKKIKQEAYQSGGDVFEYCIKEPESQVEYLIENGFDEPDIKFVRLAPNTDEKKIVSTDKRSFHKDEFKDWIMNNLDVEPASPEEFYSD